MNGEFERPRKQRLNNVSQQYDVLVMFFSKETRTKCASNAHDSGCEYKYFVKKTGYFIEGKIWTEVKVSEKS